MEKVCATCGECFNIKKYRTNTAKYCSYKCAAKKRKEIEYKDKNEIIYKKCLVCGSEFGVINKSRSRGKKTCSKQCQHKLQSSHLSEYRLPKLIKNGRRKWNKACVICKNEFKVSTANPRVQCCSFKCGQKLATKNNKYNITIEEYIKAINNCNTAIEICDFLKCSISAVYRCERRFKIQFKRLDKKDHLRNDGYYNYGNNKNHRKIYEKEYNVKLFPNQSVHHLDNDKSNNDLSNLFLTESRNEHSKIHSSIEKVAFVLYKLGYIGFDKYKREYFLIKSKINNTDDNSHMETNLYQM